MVDSLVGVLVGSVEFDLVVSGLYFVLSSFTQFDLVLFGRLDGVLFSSPVGMLVLFVAVALMLMPMLLLPSLVLLWMLAIVH